MRTPIIALMENQPIRRIFGAAKNNDLPFSQVGDFRLVRLTTRIGSGYKLIARYRWDANRIEKALSID
jgi:hypothetical protein